MKQKKNIETEEFVSEIRPNDCFRTREISGDEYARNLTSLFACLARDEFENRRTELRDRVSSRLDLTYP